MFGVAKPEFRCTECHQEIRVRLEQNRGYHAEQAELEAQGRDCVGCHLEHYGRDYELIYFPAGRQSFDHEETGYGLKGKHASLRCEQCHNAKFIPPAELASFKVNDAGRTLLGLPVNCLGCHEDGHGGQLAAECESCHSQEGWQDPPLFNHAETSFPLTGKHEQTDCAECHQPSAGLGTHAVYKGIETNSCQSCHEDPHREAFSQACESCHSTSGWKGGAPSRQFDHSTTEFPLAGKHASVACRDCHDGLDFSRTVAHDKCAECHTEDPHKGQFAARAAGGDCAACHNEQGFQPALFGIREHQSSAFPLAGRHVDTECEKCHVPEPAGVVYKLPHESCERCHEDVHAGQFAEGRYANRCDECHTVDGFQPSTFSLANHQDSSFALGGSHRAVACVDCHATASIDGVETARYHIDDLACHSCHESPHGSQFRGTGTATAPAFDCETCHTDREWKRLAVFDHRRTEFELLEAHKEAACLECHYSDAGVVQVKDVVFGDAPTECQGCHEDPHAGQFDRGGAAHECSVCHTNSNWEPTQFDHQDYSRFSLKGAHEEVACRQCHSGRQSVEGQLVIVYRGIPTACGECHGADVVDRASR